MSGKKPLCVIAIGGNALSPDKDHLSIEKQYELVQKAAGHIADLMLDGWNVVVSHGNGPQIGMIMRRSELAETEVPPVPMDYAGADIQGAVGYMFCKGLINAFASRSMKNTPVALVTQTVVDESDPALKNPSKPIGSWFTKEEAEALAKKYGWSVKEDAGRGFRRVVPSPAPKEILELTAIKFMVDNGMTVIALGGGGIPVLRSKDGTLAGIEAVIDKDMSAALLAGELGADMLILPTAVEKVAVNFGKSTQKDLDSLTVEEAYKYLESGEFPAGSMGPKIRALAGFVSSTHGVGLIVTPEKLRLGALGSAGTRVI